MFASRTVAWIPCANLCLFRGSPLNFSTIIFDQRLGGANVADLSLVSTGKESFRRESILVFGVEESTKFPWIDPSSAPAKTLSRSIAILRSSYSLSHWRKRSSILPERSTFFVRNQFQFSIHWLVPASLKSLDRLPGHFHFSSPAKGAISRFLSSPVLMHNTGNYRRIL